MMTEDEAIRLARRVADVEGWEWGSSKVSKDISRRSTRDHIVHNFVVCSNPGRPDLPFASVAIDPIDGKVLKGTYIPGDRMLPQELTKWKDLSSEQHAGQVSSEAAPSASPDEPSA